MGLAILGALVASPARGEIPIISTHRPEKNPATISTFRLNLTSGASGTSKKSASPALGLNLTLRDALESPKSRIHLDWMTEAGVENQGQLSAQFHVRAGIFPSHAPPKNVPVGTSECSWTMDAGASGKTRTHASEPVFMDRLEGPTRIQAELGTLGLCRSADSRYSVFLGGRAYRADRDSVSAPAHLDRLIGEVFAVADWSDREQRRVSGTVSLDVAPLESPARLRPRDFGGTLQLGVQASHPLFRNEEDFSHIHLGLEGKYLSVPAPSDPSGLKREHSWQAGAVVSFGY